MTDAVNTIEIVEKITEYYEYRKLAVPNTWEALAWAITEFGEAYEILMSQDTKWVRNNPENHPPKTDEDFAEELGDTIFMLIVAGMSRGVNPLQAMLSKMERKMNKE